MHLYRPSVFVFQNRFSKVFQQAFLINSQPRIPSLRTAVFCFALILTVIMAAAARPAAASGTLTATPTSASFGGVPVGTANTQTFQLKNTGWGSLTISSVTINGAGFSMSGVPTPVTVAAGMSIAVSVRFAPTAATSYSGKIIMLSNGSDPTLTINVSGTGLGAARTLSLSSTGLSFGNEIVGGTSALDVTVKNTGNSSVLISQMNVSGTGFSATSNLSGTTLAAGQSTNLQILFAPKTAGPASGKIVLTSNASNSPGSITLTGDGVTNLGHSVSLSWTASTSSGVTGYYVYRSTTSGGAYSRLNSSPTSATKYTDATVAAGETYYYELTAVTSSGIESAHSGQVTAIVP